jgi:hypothetical protein
MLCHVVTELVVVTARFHLLICDCRRSQMLTSLMLERMTFHLTLILWVLCGTQVFVAIAEKEPALDTVEVLVATPTVKQDGTVAIRAPAKELRGKFKARAVIKWPPHAGAEEHVVRSDICTLTVTSGSVAKWSLECSDHVRSDEDFTVTVTAKDKVP